MERTWTLELNEYQRNNLLWLLNACGYGHEGVPPLTFADTGDWLGEIAHMLADPESGRITLDSPGDANRTFEELSRDVSQWAQASAVMES